jgi:hypothetical protein
MLTLALVSAEARPRAAAGLAVVGLMFASGCPVSDDYDVDGAREASDGDNPFHPILVGNGTGSGGAGSAGSGASGLAGNGTGAATGAGGTGASGTGASGTGATGGSPVTPPCGSTPPSAPVCPPGCDDCINGVCRISCVGKDACKTHTLGCPDGHACSVDCLGEAACQDAQIECPSSHQCMVVCDGKDACSKVNVSCGAGDCSMSCGAGTACKDSSISCFPGGACSATCSGEAPDMLGCSTACSCQTCGGGSDDDD